MTEDQYRKELIELCAKLKEKARDFSISVYDAAVEAKAELLRLKEKYEGNKQ